MLNIRTFLSILPSLGLTLGLLASPWAAMKTSAASGAGTSRAQPAATAPATTVAATTAPVAAPVFATTPIARPDGRPWRIGYLQSGHYAEYPKTLAAIAEGLRRLGWLQLPDDMPKDLDGQALWSWLASHARSTTLEFVADASWEPGDFDESLRVPTREAILQRIRAQRDLDLMLAMGTWAGQDMRAIGPPIPTVVASVSDPLAAGISDSARDSGRDNLTVRVEPERYQRQLRLFHDIVSFKTLGLVYEDSEAGRSYAALGAAQQVGRELGFSIESCDARSSNIPTDQAIHNAVECYRDLARRNVDAVYITSHRGVTPESIKDIAAILARAKIPSFSMAGSSEVRSGVLLSLAQADLSSVGLFQAEAIARIFHGALPRQLNQIWVDPPKIALNLSTARTIGFDPPVDILLAADEVYVNEGPKP